jgi:hypothetical protein
MEKSRKDDLGIFLAFGSYHLKENRHEKAIKIFLKCIEKDSNDFRGSVVRTSSFASYLL